VRVEVGTESAGRTIWDKEGDLPTPADRDRRLQYMVTAALLHGDLTVEVYGADTAADPDRRAVRNSVTVRFQDGSRSGSVGVCTRWDIPDVDRRSCHSAV